ncbi:MAG: TraB/GumN family protein [Rhizomicrobium sp.]
MRHFLLAGLMAMTLGFSAQAQDARPAIWTVHGDRGTIYLVSSLHLLPPNLDWHRADIDHAMQSADSFVFEVPTGESERKEETRFIAQNGLLPEGQRLSLRLTPDGRQNFRRALELAGVDQSNVDEKQPWLAEVVLTVQAMYRRNYSAAHTPEGEAHDFAARLGREVRYLDTTHQQMEFLAGADESTSTEQFSAVLADFPNQADREAKFVDAWAAGDVTASAALIAAGLHGLPLEQERLNARNRDWARQIQRMAHESRIFFVAVGIAHLVGPDGVPALLRANGLAVQGP